MAAALFAHRLQQAGEQRSRPRSSAFAVIAGVVFGAAGTMGRRSDRWQIPALAVIAAVLFAEAGLPTAHVGDSSHKTSESLEQALLEVCLGVAVVLMFRTVRRRRLVALLLAAPFAVAGFALFKPPTSPETLLGEVRH